MVIVTSWVMVVVVMLVFDMGDYGDIIIINSGWVLICYSGGDCCITSGGDDGS